jgi:hypothetical protein
LKFGSVIAAYAKNKNIPLRTAMDIFYKSELYDEINEGIADLHCRSDGYLADELQLEIEHKN